jgi:hypothetical protein
VPSSSTGLLVLGNLRKHTGFIQQIICTLHAQASHCTLHAAGSCPCMALLLLPLLPAADRAAPRRRGLLCP